MWRSWLARTAGGREVAGSSPVTPTITDGSKMSEDKKTTNNSHLIIYTDGGSRGNPGPSASGYVIYTSEMLMLKEGGEYLGITTNNQAEYQAVKTALEEARKLGAVEVNCFMDSLLVVNQLLGIYKVKNRDLWPIYSSIKELLAEFNSYSIKHVPRKENSAADSMVNKILDGRQI